MKIIKVLALSTLAGLGATTGFAQSAFDGSVTAEYIYAPKDSFAYQAQLDGSLVYSASPKIKFQLDLGTTYYQGSPAIYNVGLHAIYSPSDNLNVGIYYSTNNQNYDNAGIEASYSIGKINFELAGGAFDMASSRRYISRVEAGYTFDAIGSLPGGINAYGGAATRYRTDGSPSLTSYYLGAKANIRENMEVNFRAETTNRSTYNYFTIGLEYSFGNGSIFTPRDFTSFFPGY